MSNVLIFHELKDALLRIIRDYVYGRINYLELDSELKSFITFLTSKVSVDFELSYFLQVLNSTVESELKGNPMLESIKYLIENVGSEIRNALREVRTEVLYGMFVYYDKDKKWLSTRIVRRMPSAQIIDSIKDVASNYQSAAYTQYCEIPTIVRHLNFVPVDTALELVPPAKIPEDYKGPFHLVSVIKALEGKDLPLTLVESIFKTKDWYPGGYCELSDPEGTYRRRVYRSYDEELEDKVRQARIRSHDRYMNYQRSIGAIPDEDPNRW